MFKRVLIGFFVIFAVAQVVRPAKNLGAVDGPNDVVAKHAVPVDVKALLQRACYDCHSNRTNYPWYAEIQPVGWWLAQHVNEGKEHLNFSEFGAYSVKRSINKLEQVYDEVNDHTMPLPSYTWGHPEARLTPTEIKTLTTWAETLRDEIAGE